MSLVTIKNKYQIVIPAKLRKAAGLKVGDFLEAKAEGRKITFSPKTLLDSELAESFEDFRLGRTHGPFNSASEMAGYLRTYISTKRKKKARSSR